MDALPAAIEAVSQRLDTFVTARASEAARSGTLALRFSESAADALGGGKRLRAAFCCEGWRAVTEVSEGSSPAVPAFVTGAAAALEIFQAAALVHDDLIDNSDTRRGRPSAHRRLQAGHTERSWAGDADEYGRSAAILLGDLLVAWSDDLFEESISEAPHASAARSQYALMRRDVTMGQYLDLAAESAYVETDAPDRLELALQIASLKSARYSVQQPLLIGAALAGASEAQSRALRDFGHDVGMAFQLRDDVLGVFGDETVTGKPAGDDLREGKRTALVAVTEQELSAGSAQAFTELLGDRSLDERQIGMLQETIRRTGALDRMEELIADYARRADRALVSAPLGHGAVNALRDLARRAIERSA